MQIQSKKYIGDVWRIWYDVMLALYTTSSRDIVFSWWERVRKSSWRMIELLTFFYTFFDRAEGGRSTWTSLTKMSLLVGYLLSFSLFSLPPLFFSVIWSKSVHKRKLKIQSFLSQALNHYWVTVITLSFFFLFQSPLFSRRKKWGSVFEMQLLLHCRLYAGVELASATNFQFHKRKLSLMDPAKESFRSAFI